MIKHNYRVISKVYDYYYYEYWSGIIKSNFHDANICISTSYTYLPDNINKIVVVLSNDIYAESILFVV